MNFRGLNIRYYYLLPHSRKLKQKAKQRNSSVAAYKLLMIMINEKSEVK
jgi:hypothetical protein